MFNDKYKFYFTLVFELLLWPLLRLRQEAQMAFGKTPTQYKNRKPIEALVVAVNIHEWGGYNLERSKTIKDGATFNCGLKGQLERFANKPSIELFVTISQGGKSKNIAEISQSATIIEVSNRGMDFSGYASIYEQFKDLPNRYVILTNSSVNSMQEEFLEGYVTYMEQNLDVGMLGVSYCTKMVQTLVRRNFTPHLQSFFLMTTIDVLGEVVRQNKNTFPGNGVDHKLLLIRNGEIRLSQLVQKAGYRLAVVSPVDGVPYKFECFREWKLPYGDVRQIIAQPNRITPINI